ncbi:hypothetical protein Rs2_38278 [Raphanus sativus]|nr:hypothetical protein Rs2_38278 [Raphanus sativus]
MVSSAWIGVVVSGSEQFKYIRCMKLLKPNMRKLNKNNYSGITKGVKQQSEIVENLQRLLLTDPNTSTATTEHEERAKLNVLLNAEFKFFKPKTEGNLGIRRLEEFQTVFELKQVWNFFSESGSIWLHSLRVKS